jgi:hypothetical protein
MLRGSKYQLNIGSRSKQVESCELLLQAWFCCSELPILEEGYALVRLSTCRLHVQGGKRSPVLNIVLHLKKRMAQH